MNKIEEFYNFMNKIVSYEAVSVEHDSIPRDYGVDDKVYINEARTLNLIKENDGISTSELAALEKKSNSAISQKIKKLSKKGLVFVEQDKDDYKRLNIHLTKDGLNVCKKQMELDDIFFSKIFDEIDNWESIDYNKIIRVIDVIEREKLDYIEENKKAKNKK